MSDLASKLSEQEAFDATPAGAALRRYSAAVTVMTLIDEDENPAAWDEARGIVRSCEWVLRREIKSLQTDLAIERIMAMTPEECRQAGIAEFGSEEAYHKAMGEMRERMLRTVDEAMARKRADAQG